MARYLQAAGYVSDGPPKAPLTIYRMPENAGSGSTVHA